MTYKVIRSFSDAMDNKYKYNVGDTFPREGLEVSPKRIEELSTTANKRGVQLIDVVVVRKRKKG